MCFDTTSVNSVPRNNACVQLEQKLDKDNPMLWCANCACRHHILEIMLKAVVILFLGLSIGPDIVIFKRLPSRWEAIDRSTYDTVTFIQSAFCVASKIVDSETT